MSTLDAALTWLARGVPIVPLQPGSKHLIAGFGFYREQITTEERARFWFEARPCNLAVVCASLAVLDFDAVADYERAVERWPVLGEAYTERTRRGFHVFYYGERASGVVAGGIEVKARGNVVVVSPSEVGGFVYQVEHDAPLTRWPAALLSLSEREHPHPRAQSASLAGGESTVDRVKRSLDVVALAQQLTGLRLCENGRYWSGRCPFHGDDIPSFWVDSERGLWGCRACGAHGDAVNLYARIHGLTVSEAISALAKNL